jgi:RNA polymerase sigma factor (sigma-70 family)
MDERMTPHRQLLADYAETDSQEAFHELVKLYIGMVHSAAVRLVNGDIHRAQDITQTVFADLARHAHAVSTEATLGGWLHRRTCHVATSVMRGERRRENRERQAIEMNALHENPDETLAQIAPVLDEAIDELNAYDRNAIMLRFFEHCDLRTIGEALGSNEDAAQKRVARALEKLRVLLVRRGVVLSGTALALALGSGAASAAPAELAAGVSASAIAAAHVGKGLSLTSKIIIMTKIKVTAIAISAVILAGIGTTLVVVNHEKDYAADYTPPANPDPQKILQEAQADTEAGRYKDALAKHVWFQENALKYDPALIGVKSSFALSYFGDLAQKYPPAMKKLKSMRNEAEKTIHQKDVDLKTGTMGFSEFSAINRALKENEKTVEDFIWLDSHNPALAKGAFPFADSDLIKAKEYKVYGRYIDPDRSYAQMLHLYKISSKALQSSPVPQAKELPQKSFANHAATLVALLAVNDRKADADRIAAEAAKEWNDPAFLSELESARNGVVPEPWP